MEFQVIKAWMIKSHANIFGETLTLAEIEKVQWYDLFFQEVISCHKSITSVLNSGIVKEYFEVSLDDILIGIMF